MSYDPARFKSANTEAANRAEATALLLRCGYRVYRPEADIEGEDLVIRTPYMVEEPQGKLIGVQLKGGATVDWNRYGGRDLYMLFPSAKFNPDVDRDWFLVPHDDLFTWVKKRHGHTAGWQKAPFWSYPSISQKLHEFLEGRKVRPMAEGHETKFGMTHVPADVTNPK